MEIANSKNDKFIRNILVSVKIKLLQNSIQYGNEGEVGLK
jgi:hypothetical protein